MNKLLVLPVSRPDKNKLEEAYEVANDVDTKKGSALVRVPKYFQYDGASVPPMAWQVIGTPFQPRFMVAAVFHDWLYHTHQVDRKAANDLFYDLLIAGGVREAKASVMLAAVETFGAWYWKNGQEDLEYLKRLAGRIRKDGRDPRDYGLK